MKNSVMAFAAALAVFAAVAKDVDFAVPQGTDGLRVAVRLADRKSASLVLVHADGEETVRLEPAAQIDYEQWIPRWERMRRERRKQELPKGKTYPETLVKFTCGEKSGWFGIASAILPYFEGWDGIYDHSYVEEHISEWQKRYPALAERTFRLEFRYDAAKNRMAAWLDGSYAGVSPRKGRFRQVKVAGGAGLVASVEPFSPEPPSEMLKLAAQPDYLRVHPALREKAKLSVPTGDTMIEGVPMTVWKPEESFDQGLVRETSHRTEVATLGLLNRTAWANGPEYLQWSIPSGFWCEAWVLCAAVPGGEGGKKAQPVVGTRFGRISIGGNLGRTVLDVERLPDEASVKAAPAKDARAKIVGKLTYHPGANGPAKSVPLWLVRHRLDAGEVLSTINGSGRLDFGFVGAGEWNGAPRSSVQIFGCTLVRAPADMAVEESVWANVFTDAEPAKTAVRLTATKADVKGTLEWRIGNEKFAVKKSGSFPVALSAAGAEQRFELDLAMPEPGWYSLDWILRAADGRELYTHEASFALLGRDTREAGLESPYVAAPYFNAYDAALAEKKPKTKGFRGGYRRCTGDREGLLKLMHKLGFRRSWQRLTVDENEFPGTPWGVAEVQCSFADQLKEAKFAVTDKEMQALFEKEAATVAGLREKFPHLDTFAIFQGGLPREVSQEVLGKQPVKKYLYRGKNGDSGVYCLTELCRFLRKRFPWLKLRFANTGASSERVAQWVRRGFDLNLVDELGSAARGHRRLPELAADHYAPGTLWALKETGRLLGMKKPAVGAGAEYTVRSERRVNRGDPANLRPAAYAARDWLIALAQGSRTVTFGSIEDSGDGPYDIVSGSSGLCRMFPTSYPKRTLAVLATLTKVLDRPVFSRRVPTGRNTLYALEFRRDRQVKDFAYAFWTPEYASEIELRFAVGAKVRKVTAFGVESDFTEKTLVVGEMPVYLVSDKPVAKVAVKKDLAGESPPKTAKKVYAPSIKNVEVVQHGQAAAKKKKKTNPRPLPSVPNASLGEFKARDTFDPVHGKILELKLETRSAGFPKVLSEYCVLDFQNTAKVDLLNPAGSLGVWVKGNGGFGRVGFVLRRGATGFGGEGEPVVLYPGNNGWIDFDGWQYLSLALKPDDVRTDYSGYELTGLVVGSSRTVLDPVEMQKVTDPVAIGEILHSTPGEPVRDHDELWMRHREHDPLDTAFTAK